MVRTDLHESFGQKVSQEPIAAYASASASASASFVSNALMLKLLLVAESEKLQRVWSCSGSSGDHRRSAFVGGEFTRPKPMPISQKPLIDFQMLFDIARRNCSSKLSTPGMHIGGVWPIWWWQQISHQQKGWCRSESFH